MRSLLGAPLPCRKTKGSAGYDICLPETIVFNNRNGQRVTVDTGIQMDPGDIPEGHVALIVPRSSSGMKWGLSLTNSTGVIDSDYTMDTIKLGMWLNDRSFEVLRLERGTRVAQMFIVPFATIPGEIPPVEERKGGVGSTGC